MLLGEGSLGDRPATVPQHVHRPSGILCGRDELPVRGRILLGHILQTPAGTGVAASVRRGAYQGGFDRRLLFGLFCYSLELDRPGKAIEEPAPTT
jgi:hypothetical protein